MKRRRRLACAAALVVLAATLAHDAVAATAIRHARPFLVLVLAGAVAVALLVLAPRIRSGVVALGAGVAAGGALATLVSGFAWAGGVPDPLVRGGVAFNLADIAIAVGDVLLVVGVCVHAWVNRASRSPSRSTPELREGLERRQTLDDVVRRRRSADAWPHRSIAAPAAWIPPSQRKKPIPRT